MSTKDIEFEKRLSISTPVESLSGQAKTAVCGKPKPAKRKLNGAIDNAEEGLRIG
jgi:hypothetical protein